MIIHEPWDQGVISSAFHSVLGVDSIRETLQQKTIKTVCGIRVPLLQAVHGQTNCDKCRQELLEQEASLQELSRLLEETGK